MREQKGEAMSATRQGVRNLDGARNGKRRSKPHLHGVHEHDWRVRTDWDGSVYMECAGCFATRDR